MRAKNAELERERRRHRMSAQRNVACLFLMLTEIACTSINGKVAVPRWDTPTGWGLDGYDPVAYFVDQKPVVGDPKYTYEAQGVMWKFASPEHRETFTADPGRYVPQFGGYCAFAVSLDTTAHGDPHQWAIVNDKLYVNANAIAARLWSLERSDNIDKGNKNWPNILKESDEEQTH